VSPSLGRPTACSKIHQDHCRPQIPAHVVNPAQIERQVAGSFAYGLSAALYGEITVRRAVGADKLRQLQM